MFNVNGHKLIKYFFAKFTEMSGGGSFSPVAIILKENRLTIPNYMDWKRNLNIVLTTKEYKYVLIEPCPMIGKNSPTKEREVEKAWKKANKMVRCYMWHLYLMFSSPNMRTSPLLMTLIAL
jgi:hypothetical protein